MRHLKYDLEMNVKFEKKNYFGKRQMPELLPAVSTCCGRIQRGATNHTTVIVLHM